MRHFRACFGQEQLLAESVSVNLKFLDSWSGWDTSGQLGS